MVYLLFVVGCCCCCLFCLFSLSLSHFCRRWSRASEQRIMKTDVVVRALSIHSLSSKRRHKTQNSKKTQLNSQNEQKKERKNKNLSNWNRLLWTLEAHEIALCVRVCVCLRWWMRAAFCLILFIDISFELTTSLNSFWLESARVSAAYKEMWVCLRFSVFSINKCIFVWNKRIVQIWIRMFVNRIRKRIVIYIRRLQSIESYW